jgi:uncharacterized protein YjaZ
MAKGAKAMEILPDTGIATLAELLTSTAHARERFEIARATFLVPPEPGDWSRAKGYPPFQVMEAVLRDGYDLRVAQQVFGLFSPSRKIRASVWALDRLRAEGVYEHARATIARAAAAIEPALLPATLQLAIIPADPSNRNLMIRNSGLSIFGGARHMAVEVWPSAGNLARLGPALIRGFALGVRWMARDAAHGYTLADALAAEGLAGALADDMFPGNPAPWLLAHAAPASWPGDLQTIAELYGTTSYAKVPANDYGRSVWRDLAPPPHAAPLDSEELAYAEEVILAALDTDDPRTIAAHLYGDAIVTEQGHQQAGLPPYAGFEVAYRMVRRSKRAPAAALGLPTAAIISA